eukprot:TRINITY_DN38887_c0_g1_i1.p1 TRINITY_DN38887_c0_g1~~TRINITY_DN38887_c0_g1_i1.p1  ORF type:complete len:224 (-),score=36.78 TRINITY_DN38887_c0_g1_i1:13-684(-)
MGAVCCGRDLPSEDVFLNQKIAVDELGTLSDESVSESVVRLILKEDIGSSSKEHKIRYSHGRDFLTAIPSWSVHKWVVLKNAEGKLIACIIRKEMASGPAHYLYGTSARISGQEASEEFEGEKLYCWANVAKDTNSSAPVYLVNLASGPNEFESRSFVVSQIGYLGRQLTIKKGDAGAALLGQHATLHNQYTLTVAAGVDAVVMVATVIAVDQIRLEEQGEAK